MSKYLKDCPKSFQTWRVGQTKGLCHSSARNRRFKKPVPITAEINESRTGAIDIDQEGKLGASDDPSNKIEHFFDSCQTEGLPGLQGLMIPQAAAPDMVLRRDVIQAIENQSLYLIPVRTVEEGIQILSGVEVGDKDDSGNYPAGTVNYLVHHGLRRHAVQLKRLSISPRVYRISLMY